MGWQERVRQRNGVVRGPDNCHRVKFCVEHSHGPAPHHRVQLGQALAHFVLPLADLIKMNLIFPRGLHHRVDPLERLKTQFGLERCFPPSSFRSHFVVRPFSHFDRLARRARQEQTPKIPPAPEV